MGIEEQLPSGHPADQRREAGRVRPQELAVAGDVRPGLLRHRDDGHRRAAATTWPASAWRSSAPRPARPTDDRGRPGQPEDGTGAAPGLRPDARSEVGHRDGRLRRPAAACSTTTRSCRAWTTSCRSTSTCPAARRGPRCSWTRSSSCTSRCSDTKLGAHRRAEIAELEAAALTATPTHRDEGAAAMSQDTPVTPGADQVDAPTDDAAVVPWARSTSG